MGSDDVDLRKKDRTRTEWIESERNMGALSHKHLPTFSPKIAQCCRFAYSSTMGHASGRFPTPIRRFHILSFGEKVNQFVCQVEIGSFWLVVTGCHEF